MAVVEVTKAEQRGVHPDDNEDDEQGGLLAGENRAGLQRLASLLKGTAPDALLPSPDGSPKASEAVPGWEHFPVRACL